MQYLVPDTIEAVVDALVSASGSAAVFAGGTDLLVQLRTGRRRPDLIIDLKKIPQLRSISIDAQNVRIGAAVCGAELSERQDIIREWPGVVEAFELIGSTQIQGRATMGGNLCNASPAADSIPALIAAGAVCVIAGAEGQREIAVENVVVEPGKTSLKPDEILVEFRLPRRAEYGGDAYQRFIPRTEMDIAVVGVGVNLTLDQNGVCQAARVALVVHQSFKLG